VAHPGDAQLNSSQSTGKPTNGEQGSYDKRHQRRAPQ
jgi:hypothetical protein